MGKRGKLSLGSHNVEISFLHFIVPLETQFILWNFKENLLEDAGKFAAKYILIDSICF